MSDSNVSRENYITIQGWMLTDLKLKGNELIIYACIYGFSQLDGQAFTGSRKYLSDWANCTKQGVDKCLKSLCDKGYLERQESYKNNVKFVTYWATKLSRVANKVDGGSQQSCPGVANKVVQGSQQSCPNNIDNNIDTYSKENIEDNAGAPAPAPPPPPEQKAKGKKPGIDTEALFARYTQDTKTLELLRDWLKVRKAKRAPETEKALTLNMDKLEAHARESGLTIPAYLEAVIARGWAAFYPIREFAGQRPQITRPRVKTDAEHAAGQHKSGFGWGEM